MNDQPIDTPHPAAAPDRGGHSLMQYFLLVLAFVAAVVGVTGDVWDEKLHHPTVLGWATIAVAAVSMVISAYSTHEDHAKLKKQELQRMQVQAVSKVELRQALDFVLAPFFLLLQSAAFSPSARSEAQSNKFEFDGEKCRAHHNYLIGKLKDPTFQRVWARFDLRKHPDYPSIYPSSTWGDYFSSMAISGDALLEATIAKYSAYVEPEVLLRVHALRMDDFFRMRLKELPVLVEANEHMPMYSIAMAFTGPDEAAPYMKFVNSVEDLLALLPVRSATEPDKESSARAINAGSERPEPR